MFVFNKHILTQTERLEMQTSDYYFALYSDGKDICCLLLGWHTGLPS